MAIDRIICLWVVLKKSATRWVMNNPAKRDVPCTLHQVIELIRGVVVARQGCCFVDDERGRSAMLDPIRERPTSSSWAYAVRLPGAAGAVRVSSPAADFGAAHVLDRRRRGGTVGRLVPLAAPLHRGFDGIRWVARTSSGVGRSLVSVGCTGANEEGTSSSVGGC